MYWFAKIQQFELAINWNLHCTGNHNISGFSIRIGKKSSLLSVFVLTHKLILTVMTWNDIIIAYVTRRVTVVMKPTVWLSKYLVSPYHFMINLYATSLNICWNPCVFIRLFTCHPIFALKQQISHVETSNPMNIRVCLFGHCPSDANAGLGSFHSQGAWCCARSVG